MSQIFQQIQFLQELDKLKSIERQCKIVGKERRENSAEHSWHVSMYALILSNHGPQQFDLLKVIQLLLVHDIVEIDAGDTFVYDTKARESKQLLEEEAAQRIFGLLPNDQANFYLNLWREYESGESPEAHFARGLDRLQPILQNFANQGGTWREHGIKPEQVLERNRHIVHASPFLWEFVQGLVNEAIELGYFD